MATKHSGYCSKEDLGPDNSSTSPKNERKNKKGVTLIRSHQCRTLLKATEMTLNEGELVRALAWQTPEWKSKLTYRPSGRGAMYNTTTCYKCRTLPSIKSSEALNDEV